MLRFVIITKHFQHSDTCPFLYFHQSPSRNPVKLPLRQSLSSESLLHLPDFPPNFPSKEKRKEKKTEKPKVVEPRVSWPRITNAARVAVVIVAGRKWKVGF